MIRNLTVLLMLLVVGCSVPRLPSFSAPAPTATLPVAATPTRVEASAPIALAATMAPIATTAPAAANARPPITAPTVRDRVVLRDLPGIGRHPLDAAWLGDTLYVLNNDSRNIAVIQNDRITKFIPTIKRPNTLAIDPAQKRLYVANGEDKSISLIVNDQITLTSSIGEEPRVVIFFENRLWVGLDTKATILVLDPATLQTQASIQIPGAFSIINFAGDAVHHRVYVGLYDKTAVIDSATLRYVKTFDTKGSYQTLIAYPPRDVALIEIYDSESKSNYLAGFDPVSGSPIQGRVKIGGDPRAAVLSADGTRLYVANSYSNTITVIDPRELTEIATIPVDLRPYGLALNENMRRLYVANYDSDNLSVIDTQTNRVINTLPLGMLLTALAANENAGRVYVASAATDSVFVLEGTRVVKEIGVGRHPVDLSRDPQTNRLFVANAADNTLSIIDETTFSVRATSPITNFLTTVAVDSARNRVFAGGVILDATSLAPAGQLILHGLTIGSSVSPVFVRVNPAMNRIYALAGNGVPGSNGRTVTYSISGDTLQQRAAISGNGNSNFIAIDPKTNRVFIAGTHPMAYTNDLTAFDANDTKLFSLPLGTRPAGMTFNPQTNHLFISGAPSYGRGYGAAPTQADNTITILDTTTFGQVTQLTMNTPGKMEYLGNTIYIANREDGSVALIEDVSMLAPPPPTPTRTPSPYPTLPPLPSVTPVRANTPRASATPITSLPLCGIPPAAFASQKWNVSVATQIGCPIEAEHSVAFAAQSFERGSMFWREDDKKIIVLFNDRTWSHFDDMWTSTLSEDACPTISVPSNLIKPKRGFGKVWCDQSAVRAKIGSATNNEFAYSALVQKFERGQMFAGTQANQVFVLSSSGRWE